MAADIYRDGMDDNFVNGITNDSVGGYMKSYADKFRSDLKTAAERFKKFYNQGIVVTLFFFNSLEGNSKIILLYH